MDLLPSYVMEPVAPCFGGSTPDAPGYASGGNRVFVGATNASAALAPGVTAKATYDIRML